VITIFSAGCANSTSKEKNDIEKNRKASFKQDIARSPEGKAELYDNIRVIADSLRLDRIEFGTEGIEIRVWVRYAPTLKHQLFIVKNTASTWKGYYMEFTPHFDSIKKILTYEKSTVEKQPKIGWELFYKKILELDLEKLPDYSKLDNYFLPHHSDFVVFEYSTSKVYRLFSYASPGFVQGVTETKKVSKILKLISYQFDEEFLYTL